ncbi:hypothetical protein R5W24_001633 [Gemmata sp. JC717]|uniref:Uncharacterized protein n=1 Tax=Gemmata algarum TaxID=2975278 RepID=A0ABU5F0V6_9BACT|nr:hypothetical protein [Gemmata algarum]MDY3552549.1 hypothetical protein [Gemmata algarum]MDY3561216.1 hypothetical protein [Gemmata algarum]
MSELAGFIDAILNDLDDDTPRLVFAATLAAANSRNAIGYGSSPSGASARMYGGGGSLVTVPVSPGCAHAAGSGS